MRKKMLTVKERCNLAVTTNTTASSTPSGNAGTAGNGKPASGVVSSGGQAGTATPTGRL
jgi:hypothetical protein